MQGRHVLGLDVRNRRTRGGVVGLFGHTQLILLYLGERLQLGAVEAATTSSEGRLMRLEVFLVADAVEAGLRQCLHKLLPEEVNGELTNRAKRAHQGCRDGRAWSLMHS